MVVASGQSYHKASETQEILEEKVNGVFLKCSTPVNKRVRALPSLPTGRPDDSSWLIEQALKRGRNQSVAIQSPAESVRTIALVGGAVFQASKV